MDIYLAVGVFVIGLILAVAIKKFDFGDSATFITLLVTPLLVYGIASGKILEFSAPGGWGAKFREVANQPVTPLALTPLAQAVAELQIIEKGGVSALPSLGANLRTNKPIALTFQLGQTNYSIDAAEKYVQVLLLADREMVVLVLDADKKFVAMTEGATFRMLLSDPAIGPQIINALAGGNRSFFTSLTGFHGSSIKATDTNAVALERMRTQNTREIVVVDDNNRPVGIVKRDDIVARLLEKLATPDKS